MADAADSKSADGNIVRVQVPPSAPIQQYNKKNRIHYGFFVVCNKVKGLNPYGVPIKRYGLWGKQAVVCNLTAFNRREKSVTKDAPIAPSRQSRSNKKRTVRSTVLFSSNIERVLKCRRSFPYYGQAFFVTPISISVHSRSVCVGIAFGITANRNFIDFIGIRVSVYRYGIPLFRGAFVIDYAHLRAVHKYSAVYLRNRNGSINFSGFKQPEKAYFPTTVPFLFELSSRLLSIRNLYREGFLFFLYRRFRREGRLSNGFCSYGRRGRNLRKNGDFQ